MSVPSTDPFVTPIIQSETGKRLLPGLIRMALDQIEAPAFFEQLTTQLAQHLPWSDIVVLQGTKGQWRLLGRSGSIDPLPVELLGETLDRQQGCESEGFVAFPLRHPARFAGSSPGYVLLARQTRPGVSADTRAAVAAVQLACDIYGRMQSAEHRCAQLQTVLDITTTWSQTKETSQLLQSMAEAATQLMDAERATIFLRSRRGDELIGRPALGVESGELRIPSHTGVVGQVIDRGEPRRIDHDIPGEQAQIDRAIDEQLNYQTRSLLCVPLVNSRDQVIGAFELINKRDGHFDERDQDALQELAKHAAVAIENTQHLEQIDQSRRNIANAAAEKIQMIGESPAVRKIRETIHRLAATDLAVLILGENGTGKEVVSQMIHYGSQRRSQVLVAVNCAAISETLLESELFGHERGAFTDAQETRQGKFELADGGTLFLDEIGDMSAAGQAKLLRVLEDKVVVRVGGSVPIPTDVRVIAATNQDLEAAVVAKKFRQDLFFRLNVVTMELPPLRERGDDLLLLADHFLQSFCAKAGRDVPALTAAARNKLLAHHWPGNVRELRNQMERLSYLLVGDTIDADDLTLVDGGQTQPAGVPADLPLTDATRHFQVEYIREQIRRAGGNMTDAASRLGLHRSNLYRKMKQLDMDEPEN